MITSKQRAYLKGLAMTMDPILQLGKGGLTPENTASVDEALAARELIKINVLQNCLEDSRQMAGDSCRAYPFSGGTGDWQKNRTVP